MENVLVERKNQLQVLVDESGRHLEDHLKNIVECPFCHKKFSIGEKK